MNRNTPEQNRLDIALDGRRWFDEFSMKPDCISPTGREVFRRVLEALEDVVLKEQQP